MSDPTPMITEEVETTCYCDIPCGEIIAYGVCKSSPTALPAMSEQPPEGDNVVLGKGGTFEVHGHFDGWAAYPGGPWEAGNWKGGHSDVIYAAPRDSEVARLNSLAKPPAVHGEGDITMQDVRLHLGEGCLTNADILKGCGIHMRRKSADKDALIRGLVEALEFYADVSKYPVPKTGGLGELYFDCGDTAKAALRQAEQGGGEG